MTVKENKAEIAYNRMFVENLFNLINKLKERIEWLEAKQLKVMPCSDNPIYLDKHPDDWIPEWMTR